jgi:hypothetical protein
VAECPYEKGEAYCVEGHPEGEGHHGDGRHRPRVGGGCHHGREVRLREQLLEQECGDGTSGNRQGDPD